MKTPILFLALALLLTAGCSKKEAAKDSPAVTPSGVQTLCPVTNDPIDKKVFVDMQGQRVYFCNEGCAAAFAKDPETYFAKLEELKIIPENIQTTCPVMGGDINKSLFRDYKGRRVYFCCKACFDEFEKSPESVLSKLPGEQPAKPPVPNDPHAGHNHG